MLFVPFVEVPDVLFVIEPEELRLPLSVVPVVVLLELPWLVVVSVVREAHPNVLAVTGKAGNGIGEFGEAHFIAVSPKGDLWVADSANRAVQKFIRK